MTGFYENGMFRERDQREHEETIIESGSFLQMQVYRL